MNIKQTRDDTTVAGLNQFLDVLKRRKILWEFHLGTANAAVTISSSTSSSVSVTLDGDSNPITAQSIIGGFLSGTRVAVIFVPPSGYYIVGQMDIPIGPLGVVDSVITTASSVSVGTTETVCFTTAGATYLPNRLYRASWQGVMQSTVAAARGQQRIRKGNTTGGTQLVLAGFTECIAGSVNETASFSGYFVNNSGGSLTTAVSLTLIQAGAAGTLIEAASASSPAGLLIFDEGVCPTSLTAGLASL